MLTAETTFSEFREHQSSRSLDAGGGLEGAVEGKRRIPGEEEKERKGGREVHTTLVQNDKSQRSRWLGGTVLLAFANRCQSIPIEQGNSGTLDRLWV